MENKYLFLFFVAVLIFGPGYSRAQTQGNQSIMDVYNLVFLEKLIATAKENYPSTGISESQVNIAKSNLIAQKSNWLDGLSFSYTYNPNNTIDIIRPNFFNGYQVSVSFTVTSLFQKSSSVRQAKESVKIAEYSQAQNNLNLAAEVKRRYFTYIQAEMATALQNKAYADAVNTNKDVQSKFERGEIALDVYISAQQSLNGYLNSKLSAETSFQIAKTTLEELLTKKVEEVR